MYKQRSESRYLNQEAGSSLSRHNPLTSNLISTAYIQAHFIFKKSID